MGYPFQAVGKQRPGTGYIQTNEPLSTRTVQCTRIDHQLLFLFDAGIGRETVSQWVGVNPELKTELQGNGWREGKKMLTPLQVRTIVQYLGEP